MQRARGICGDRAVIGQIRPAGQSRHRGFVSAPQPRSRRHRWSELRDLCQRHGELVAGAAANFLTASHDPAYFDSLSEPEWDQLVSFELRLCREPGVLDAGTHILAAIRTPTVR